MSQPDKAKKNKGRQHPPFRMWFFGQLFRLARRYGSQALFWIGIGYCVHEIGKTVTAFAGKMSFADLGLSFFANVSIVWTVNISISGLSIALYLRERSIHRATRERLTSRITTLELKLDRTRTSSHLTPKGLTQKEDE